MKKCLLLCLMLVALLSIITGWLVFPLGEHFYQRKDVISYWLYTPDSLKALPIISDDVFYHYNYDVDTQSSSLTITWRNVADKVAAEAKLLAFLQRFNAPIKYNCLWRYHDKQDYSRHYQRYCLFQRTDAVELVYVDVQA